MGWDNRIEQENSKRYAVPTLYLELPIVLNLKPSPGCGLVSVYRCNLSLVNFNPVKLKLSMELSLSARHYLFPI